MSIDFERAKLLLDVIIEAGKHGPIYQKLVSEAQSELRTMIGPVQTPKTLMPVRGGDQVPAVTDPDTGITTEAPSKDRQPPETDLDAPISKTYEPDPSTPNVPRRL